LQQKDPGKGNKAKQEALEGRGSMGIDDRWTGTAMIYTARGRDSYGLWGDYKVNYRADTDPEDLRAVRLAKQSRGRTVAALGDDKLNSQLVVIFGADMSADSAVKTLEALILRIKDQGLCTGTVTVEDDLIYEPVTKNM
jgi:hypothetical protein